MSNELVAQKPAGLLAMVNVEADAFSAAANELGANIAGLFSFSGNDGKWKYKGQEIEAGTAIAVNPERMRKGFVCWMGGKPVDKVVEPILGGAKLPHKSELKDHGEAENENDGWAELVELPVKFLDTGEEADISLSSKSGVNALLRLGSDWATKSKFNLDDTGAKKVCIVEIGAQGFKPKNAPGTKYAPTLKIIAWEDAAALNAHLSADAGEEEPEAASPAPPPPAPKKPAVGFRPGAGKRV